MRKVMLALAILVLAQSLRAGFPKLDVDWKSVGNAGDVAALSDAECWVEAGGLSHAAMAALCACQHIRGLWIGPTSVLKAENVQALAKLPKLECLIAQDRTWSTKEWQHLADCTALSWLDVSGGDCVEVVVPKGGSVFDEFKRLPSLQSLLLSRIDWVSSGDIRTLSQIPTLRALHLVPHPQLSSDAIGSFVAKQGLRELSLEGLLCDDDECIRWISRASFKRLVLTDAAVTGKTLAALGSSKSINSISLLNCDGIDDGALDQESLLRLTELEIAGCDLVSDVGMASCLRSKSLQVVHIHKQSVGSATLKQLVVLTQLRSLSLVGCSFQDGILNDLLGTILPKMNVAELWISIPSGLDSSELASARAIKSIVTLSLRGSRLREDAIAGLQLFTNIKCLDLRDCGLNPDHIQTITKALPKCTVRS